MTQFDQLAIKNKSYEGHVYVWRGKRNSIDVASHSHDWITLPTSPQNKGGEKCGLFAKL